MRIKLLSAIACFLITTFAISSCMESGSDVEYSTDATIMAFGIDTIHGKYYQFTIDQLNRHIYNHDSLPVGADTIIDRIIVDTILVTGTVSQSDTLFNAGDSTSLTSAINRAVGEGMKFKVYAADGFTTREYTLSVHVHLQHPDSLVWEDMQLSAPVFSTTVNPNHQKSIVLNEDLLLLTSTDNLYRTSTLHYGWSQEAITGLPTTADLTSVVNFQETLYMLDSTNGDIYTSNNGKEWSKNEALSTNITTLLGALYTNELAESEAILTAIQKDAEGNLKFCHTSDLTSWEVGADVPEEFPTKQIYATIQPATNGINKLVAVGMPLADKNVTMPWFTIDGKNWVSLENNTFNTSCPGIENPAIIHYGGNYYIFGGEFEALYTSETGIPWSETEKDVLLPEAFKGKGSYSMSVDKNHFIWIIWGGNGTPNEVWRGRINRLAFKIQ